MNILYRFERIYSTSVSINQDVHYSVPRVTQRAGVAQVFSFSGVSTLTVDPAGGSDVVTVLGTAGDDTVTVDVDFTMVTRVGTTLAVRTPNATTGMITLV